mgnify:CR=1 FL=1
MKEYDAAKGKLERKKRQERKAIDAKEKKETRKPQKVESGIRVIPTRNLLPWTYFWYLARF